MDQHDNLLLGLMILYQLLRDCCAWAQLILASYTTTHMMSNELTETIQAPGTYTETIEAIGTPTAGRSSSDLNLLSLWDHNKRRVVTCTWVQHDKKTTHTGSEDCYKGSYMLSTVNRHYYYLQRCYKSLARPKHALHAPSWGERSESLPSLQRCNFVCLSVHRLKREGLETGSRSTMSSTLASWNTPCLLT